MPTVNSGGCRIDYQVDGPAGAPPLLLVSSLGSTKDVLWSRQVPALSRAFRVIRYDPRGHGQSSAPHGDYTLDRLGQDALAVLDALGIRSAHVCGVSLGGITALWLGVHAPGRVERLVAANTSARIGTDQSWADRIALVEREGLSGVAAQAMTRWFTEPFRAREPDAIAAFRAMVESIVPEGYLGCCAALRDGDLRKAIEGIRAPLLAIAGSADALTPPEALAFIHEHVPGSSLLTLDCSHISNVELADEFNGAVLDFLLR